MKPLVPLATLIAISCLGCGQSQVVAPSGAADAATVGDATNVAGTVTVEIRWGEDEDSPPTLVREFPDVADGTTLESVMRQLTDTSIDFSGSGKTAFIQAIGDQSTVAGKGWTFKIDDEFANQGIGQTILHPPCKVTWSYGSFEG